MRRLSVLACALGLLVSAAALAAPEVQVFTPTGTVKGVRQVQVRFSEPMVSFGDPRVAAPFAVDCAAAGESRWVDTRNWVYDFAQDLPGGLRCRFTLQPDARAADGTAVTGTRQFEFSTGGPAVLQTEPWEGGQIDEEQIFLLGLDAPATRASIEANAHCRAEGIVEAIGVEVLEGKARRDALDANPYFVRRYASARLNDRYYTEMIARRPVEETAVRARYEQLIDGPDSGLVAVRCRQRLPSGVKFALDWGPGILTPQGVASDSPQSFTYEVRPAFRATFNCERVNRAAKCIPALGMSVNFSAPIARELAAAIRLQAADGSEVAPRLDGNDNDAFVQGVRFRGPLPARSTFTLSLPPSLTDDAGRLLDNQQGFPLTVATDDDPPLAKFAATFGIVELVGEPTLPVTVRNLEPNILRQPAPPAAPAPSLAGFVRDLAERAIPDEPPPEAPLAVASIRGRVLKLAGDDIAAIGPWFNTVEEAQRDVYDWDEEKGEYLLKKRAGETEVLQKTRDAALLEVPRGAPAKAFEVIGIPLREPGFYVVELASPRLGATLFGKAGTYYVQSLALVTNLGVHLKLGRESSLVWVTALDSGKPVARAAVSIRDCAGNVHWTGHTDASGIATIDAALPRSEDRPACDWNSRGLVAVASLGEDTGFVASNWNDGIATWQFGLPSPTNPVPRLTTTIFDRTLLRTGETVHMKHVMRQHNGQGFAHWTPQTLSMRIRHEGSGDEFAFDAELDAATGSGTSTWEIPANARLGTYQVELRDGEAWLAAGSFRVEAFRVPLLRADLQPRGVPLIRPTSLALDVQLNYLAGGPAGDLPVNLRGVLQPRSVSFADYPDFVFMNGDVQEGLTEQAERAWSATNDEDAGSRTLGTQAATLDAQGGARLALALPADLTLDGQPATLVADLEYADPNGETLTAATSVAVWPAAVVLGLKPDGWALSRKDFRFQVVALDLDGAPLKDVEISVDLLQRNTYSHRKRLIGGFYAYEHKTEVKKIGAACSGRTDAQGLLNCTSSSPVSGNLILKATTRDADGHPSVVHRDVWVAGDDDWWYAIADHDRMDLIPERKRYEPGETARLQVRMPFRSARALVTVEREGVIESFVTTLEGRAPVIELPIRGHHAPNMFVSVLAVRGRDSEVQPTALVDLGRPAYKLGMTTLRVGWRTHELNVRVQPAQSAYRVRDKAVIDLDVTRADGKPLGADAELALAAVDEGLLELRPNDSWALLETMMGQRGIEVQTSTAQMQVVGRRHYGRKAVAPGGGGGAGGANRSLFDTLLHWQPRVKLDARGHARVVVPLNDSLTSFRIAAVATAGAGHFGTGSASIRTTQDLMLFSGLPPIVRAGDRYRAMFTVRNAGERALNARVTPQVRVDDATPLPALAAQEVSLEAGAARELAWEVEAPADGSRLHWTIAATTLVGTGDATTDTLEVGQRVIPALPVRTFQATLTQLTAPLALPVAQPADALPGRGGVGVKLQARLADSLDGVRDYMNAYPYRCLEQQVSRAIALQDDALWQGLMNELPAYLDSDGLAKYFPTPGQGSDVLSSYLLAIAAEAGLDIPESARQRLRQGLVSFIEGRLNRDSPLATADLVLRKLAAIEALSRYPDGISQSWLDSLDLEPTLWPTSGVLDFIDILRRHDAFPDRDARLTQALGILRARINLQGTTMSFSTEERDALWWLMLSADVNANRALLSVLERADWADDVPRLVTGTLGRQQRGHWDTTTANAWGTLALQRFSARFESAAVTGTTRATLDGQRFDATWQAADTQPAHEFAWPAAPSTLAVAHDGGGAPWLSVQSRAAIPLRAPLFTGYRITRTVTPVHQRTAGRWQRGDVYRVRLELHAQSDMTWVVVNDPLPAGATALGSGLGRGSPALTGASGPAGPITPMFEERRQDVFHAYFDFVPKGGFSVEYTVRLNNAGHFQLPPTRVEAMYAPEMFGELPNATVTVEP